MAAKLIPVCAVSAIVCALAIASEADRQSRQQVLLDDSKPGVYVTFERFGSRAPEFEGESERRVWLTLHNNYLFSIVVPTFALREPQDCEDPHRSCEVNVPYSVESVSPESDRTLPEGYTAELQTLLHVKPGDSLLFSIPAEHLNSTRYILVPFEIEDETGPQKGGIAPRHYAIFLGWLLPQE